MASSYPTGTDAFVTTRTDATLVQTTHAADHNNYADALNKIEAELGLSPSDTFATVTARLADMAADIAAVVGSGGAVTRYLSSVFVTTDGTTITAVNEVGSVLASSTDFGVVMSAVWGPNRLILLAEGVYNVQTLVDVTGDDFVEIRGSGHGTVIRQNNTRNLEAVLKLDGSAPDSLIVRDLIIDGNKANNATTTTGTNVGLKLTSSSTTVVKVVNVIFRDCTTRGFSTSSGDTWLVDCISENNGTGGLGFNDGANYGMIRNCLTRNNGADGIYIGGQYFSIDGCTSYGNGDTGYNYGGDGSSPNGDSGWHRLTSCIAYNNAKSGFNSGGSNYVTHSSCISFANGRTLSTGGGYSGAGFRVRDHTVGPADTSRYVSFHGCIAYEDTVNYALGGSLGQKYGIEIVNHSGLGLPDWVVIQGCILANNTTAPIVCQSATTPNSGTYNPAVLVNGSVQGNLGVNDSVKVLTKAGVPADSDFTLTPPNGTLALNTSTSTLYARVGGSWVSL